MTVVPHHYQDQCETLKERAEREGGRRRGTRMKKRLKRPKKCPLFSTLKNVIEKKRGNIYCGTNSILISYWGLLRNSNSKTVEFVCFFLELRLFSIYSCCVADGLECVGYKEYQSRITESYVLELDSNCKRPCTAGRPALSSLTSNCIEKHVGITIWLFKPQKNCGELVGKHF